MKRSVLFQLFLFMAMVALSSMGPVALAQDDDEDADIFTLEEVTVTAAKSGEHNLQKVPIAMDVVTGEAFAANAKDDVDDILSNMAGVYINTSSDGMRISIRGIADTDSVFNGNKTSSPTVAMNVDGAYNSMNNSGQNLFDVERIEVLMGPQSTLYASNSPGGVVNIITASPKTDKFSASLSALYGSYEHSELKATLNAPIVKDKLAARLALNRTRQNNFLEPYTDDLATKNDAARLKLLWDATDTLDITLTGNYGVNGNRGEMTQKVEPFDKASGSSDWTAADDASGAMNSIEQESTGMNLTVSWESPLGNLSIEPNYSKSDGSGPQEGTAMIGMDEKEAVWESTRTTEQTSAEVRLASSDDFELMQYVVGVFYYENEFRGATEYSYIEDVTNPADSNSTNTNDAEQKAVYANVTYPLPFNEKLSVTGGFRYSWDWARQTDSSATQGDTEMDEANPDYKLGFQYDLDDLTMFYGSYTSSFRTDGMAMYNYTGYRPAEEMKAYTIGAKTRMLDNRIQLNASAYYYDYRNRIAQDSQSMGDYTQEELEAETFGEDITFFNGDTFETIEAGTTYWDAYQEYGTGRTSEVENDDGTTTTYYNIEDQGFNSWGNLRTIGVDVSVSWIPTSKDMVDFSVSYLDMEWTDLEFTYLYTNFFDNKCYDGATAPNAPEWSMTASYEHKFDIAHYGTLTPHFDVQHKTGFDLIFDQSDGTGYGHQEAYWLYNASLGFTSASQKWNVNFVVKNITNYAVKKSYMVMMGEENMLLGDPRTYSFTVSIKF
jgi:iron complex outermembrane receptor protein